MLYLNAEDVNKLFSMRDAIESDKKAFSLQSRKETELPVRISFMVKEDSSSQFMPAYVRGDVNRAGIKVVSTFPGNPKRGLPAVTAQVLLLDNETGETAAIMNGTEITRIRTGAISGAATEILARENCEKAALFGTGGQARGQLEALLTVRKLREVLVYDIFEENRARFVKAMQPMADKFSVTIKAAGSSDEAIDGADIISAATTSPVPVFDGSKVMPGAHINGIGSYLPDRRELDAEVVTKGRVFVDNMEAVSAEAGDFIIPCKEGIFSFDRIAGELGDVICGKVEGRQNDRQITVMKAVGFAVLDVVAAWNIYNKAKELGAGRELA